ncbi:MAG: hypothetical protein J6Y90_07480 [Lachnospiraceae bacterium]|nr:hypothetical protein [Lachnospiraceae bacterium]
MENMVRSWCPLCKEYTSYYNVEPDIWECEECGYAKDVYNLDTDPILLEDDEDELYYGEYEEEEWDNTPSASSMDKIKTILGQQVGVWKIAAAQTIEQKAANIPISDNSCKAFGYLISIGGKMYVCRSVNAFEFVNTPEQINSLICLPAMVEFEDGRIVDAANLNIKEDGELGRKTQES